MTCTTCTFLFSGLCQEVRKLVLGIRAGRIQLDTFGYYAAAGLLTDETFAFEGGIEVCGAAYIFTV